MADLSGQQFGDYQLLRRLGSGTFGEVYEGEQIYLKTHVAIKVLHAQLDQTEFQRFIEEARTIASLEHPHIVRVLSFSIQQHTPYLVMQLAQCSLKDRFVPGPPQPVETILPYLRQASEGLQYAHDQHLMHLDIKPANLLLTAQNQVLLADFGLALALQAKLTHLTLHGFTGTPGYAAPEQFQNKPGLASDQYALGVIVYQWLVGRLPFEGDWWAMGHQKMTRDPPSLCDQVPDISSTVEDVVLRALARNPKARFATVQHFATALTQAAQPGTEQTARKADPVMSITSLDSERAVQSTRTQVIPPIDGAAVLRSVRSGETPPTWRVFTVSTGKVSLASIAVGTGTSLPGGFFALILLTVFKIPLDSIIGWVLLLTALVFVLGIVLMWHSLRDVLLILMPEGLVSGKRGKLEPRLVVNFKDTLALQAKGTSIRVTLPKEGGMAEVKEPDLATYFASPKQLALSIADAYEAFKKNNSA